MTFSKRSLVLGTACAGFFLALSTALFGQSPAQLAKARQACSDAVSMHADQKPTQALAKLNIALGLDPKNVAFLNYRAELETIVNNEALDRHALTAPSTVEKSVESLAAYLVKPAKNDRDKARLIYRWITDRIAYDTEAVFSGKRADKRPQAVLQNRKAVCEGYAGLFYWLCREAGLDVATVIGHTKETVRPPGQEFPPPDHSWNAVKLDDCWHLVEPTWGAGALQGNKFKKGYREYFFLTPPEEFIFTHFPVESRWQLLPTPVSQEEFKRWPRVPVRFFDLGFTAKEVGLKVQEKGFTEFVQVFDPPGPKILVRTAPLERTLRNGSKYRFRIETVAFEEMSIFNAGKLSSIPRKADGSFDTELVARKGDLRVTGWFVGSKNNESILRYKVD